MLGALPISHGRRTWRMGRSWSRGCSASGPRTGRPTGSWGSTPMERRKPAKDLFLSSFIRMATARWALIIFGDLNSNSLSRFPSMQTSSSVLWTKMGWRHGQSDVNTPLRRTCLVTTEGLQSGYQWPVYLACSTLSHPTSSHPHT